MKPFKTFVAGCGRQTKGPENEVDLAYTLLAFPECPACVHRLEPEGAPSFCRWLPADTPKAFAALASLDLCEGETKNAG